MKKKEKNKGTTTNKFLRFKRIMALQSTKDLIWKLPALHPMFVGALVVLAMEKEEEKEGIALMI